MNLSLSVGYVTDRGRVREVNEDSCCILLPPHCAPDIAGLFAVADGMGGHQAGEVASQYVSDTLKQLFGSAKYQEWVEFKPGRDDYYSLALKEIIERLNDEVHRMASRREEWRGMGTTATIAIAADGKLYLGHVGDSRAYLLNNGEWRQISRDHSWVMEQVEQRAMTPDQAAVDPRKNQLTRALGITSLVRVERSVHELGPNSTLLLCTDGLINLVSDGEIERMVRATADIQNTCQALVDLANQRGGDDNITVIVVQTKGESPAHAVRKTQEKVAGLTTLRLQAKNRRQPKRSRPVRADVPIAPGLVEQEAAGSPTAITAKQRRLPFPFTRFQTAAAFIMFVVLAALLNAAGALLMYLTGRPELVFFGVAGLTFIILIAGTAICHGWHSRSSI